MNDLEPDNSLNYNGFLKSLTELSAKFGIAISSDAVVYSMERDDMLFQYVLDSSGKLERA